MGSAEHPIEPAARFAIIGYAARLPGAQDTDGFWDVLRKGHDAVSEVPKDRWNVDEFFDIPAVLRHLRYRVAALAKHIPEPVGVLGTR